MTNLHSFKDGLACFANIRMDNNEPVFISVARTGVLVKESRLGFFGRKLFASNSPEHVVKTAMTLAQNYPEQKTPSTMSDPILKTYCNAVLHCRSTDEVEEVLKRAGES